MGNVFTLNTNLQHLILRKQELEIKQQAGGMMNRVWKSSGMSQSSWQSDGGFAGCCFNKVVKLLCWMTSVLCTNTNEIWTQNLNPHNLIQALWLHHKPCLQHLGHVDYQITGCYISTLFYSVETEMMKKHALPTISLGRTPIADTKQKD